MSQIEAVGPMASIRTRPIYSNIKTCFHDKFGQFSTRPEIYASLHLYQWRLEITFWSRNITKYNGQRIAHIFPVMSFHCKNFFGCFRLRIWGILTACAKTNAIHWALTDGIQPSCNHPSEAASQFASSQFAANDEVVCLL